MFAKKSALVLLAALCASEAFVANTAFTQTHAKSASSALASSLESDMAADIRREVCATTS